MIDINQQKAVIGIRAVMNYLISQGKNPIDVSTNKKHKGYDILSDNQKIEVKCSTKEKGIPDCFGSEFEDNRLKADFMYIVRINELNPYRIDILSKEEFDRYAELHNKKIIVKIASKLKTDLFKQKVGRAIKI